MSEFDRDGKSYSVVRNNYGAEFFSQIDKLGIEDVLKH